MAGNQNPFDMQIKLLMKLAEIYDRIALGLDEDAYNDVIKMTQQVRWYIPDIKQVRPTKKDWGEMSSQEIRGVLSVV